jgi:hypothetical protein
MWKAISIISVLAAVLALDATMAPWPLGTARVPVDVFANGKLLPAGDYDLRLATEPGVPAIDQPAPSERWVEFVKDGVVVGRELATIVADTEIGIIAECVPPDVGKLRVDALKGGDYLRIWVNYQGCHYLIHLPIVTDVIESGRQGAGFFASAANEFATPAQGCAN